MRVISGDVGGGFGTKGWQYVEHRLTLWAARKLGRPVKWTCERSETVLAVYRIPTAYINVVGVLSNTNPTAPYRGAGRPEAIYLLERLIDDAARELGVDRVELRRRNILPESALPYQSPVGPYYDCGQFEKNMDMAIELADVAGFAARVADSEKQGKLRGLGIVNAIEQAAG